MKKYLMNNEPYLIAETGYSFEGDADYLRILTEELPVSINAIKYHLMLNVDEYVVESYDLKNLLRDWLITEEDWSSILRIAKGKNKDVIILADDIKSVEFCEKNDNLVDVIEVHAACVNDTALLKRVIDYVNKYDKVLMLGCSGFEIGELQDVINYVKKENVKNLLLMYGFQNFPTSIELVNLSKIAFYKSLFDCSVGFADHTEYSNPLKEQVILASYALGSNIQEVHYVMNQGEDRTDYITAVDKERLSSIKEKLVITNKSIGNVTIKLNSGEKDYLKFRKVPVFNCDVKKGDVFDQDKITYKRVEKPLRQHRFKEIEAYFGYTINGDYSFETEINSDMIDKE